MAGRRFIMNVGRWSGRSDWDAEVVWQFKNLGFGNRGLVTQRRGEQWQAAGELFRIQDLVAAEVAQAHAQGEAAAVRGGRAEAGRKAAPAACGGDPKGLSETAPARGVRPLGDRPPG